jgi:hypothetical protein
MFCSEWCDQRSPDYTDKANRAAWEAYWIESLFVRLQFSQRSSIFRAVLLPPFEIGIM